MIPVVGAWWGGGAVQSGMGEGGQKVQTCSYKVSQS